MNEDTDDFLSALADLYAGAREQHWFEAEVLAEYCSGHIGSEAREAVDREAFLNHLREQLAESLDQMRRGEGKVLRPRPGPHDEELPTDRYAFLRYDDWGDE